MMRKDRSFGTRRCKSYITEFGLFSGWAGRRDTEEFCPVNIVEAEIKREWGAKIMFVFVRKKERER